jgi:hypothetical protein
MKFDDYMNDSGYMADDGGQLDQCEDCTDGYEATAERKPKMIEVEEVLGTGTSETISEICVTSALLHLKY